MLNVGTYAFRFWPGFAVLALSNSWVCSVKFNKERKWNFQK
jgi:hypothetical protein